MILRAVNCHLVRGAVHPVHRIVRHIRRAHRAYRAHWASRVVCYAVAGGMALGGAAMLAHPPVSGDWAPWPMIASVPAPGPQLLPPSAFVAPAPVVWPAAYVPSVPPMERDHECDHPNLTTMEWCREHRHSVPEPTSFAVLGVALTGLAIGRRYA